VTRTILVNTFQGTYERDISHLEWPLRRVAEVLRDYRRAPHHEHAAGRADLRLECGHELARHQFFCGVPKRVRCRACAGNDALSPLEREKLWAAVNEYAGARGADLEIVTEPAIDAVVKLENALLEIIRARGAR